ncbi:MAG: hypothetical protein KDA92_07260 [Planctomycetales bacterium]|nr:hypothetical protein [Planctomycetales bacterium]
MWTRLTVIQGTLAAYHMSTENPFGTLRQHRANTARRSAHHVFPSWRLCYPID